MNSSSTNGNARRGRRKKIRTEPIRPICPQCEKQFSNQSALTKHKLTHSDERRFACQQCSKAFKRHDHLTGHMQTHSNRKPFNCTIQGCDKTYCDARSLRRHKENIHHIVTPREANNSSNNSSNNSTNNINNNNNNNNNANHNGQQQQQQQLLHQQQAASMHHLDSQLLRRRDSDGGGSLYSLETQGSNEHLQHQHHQHYVPYSADYVSTKRQQFNFCFDFDVNQPNQQFSNTMAHSVESIADSSIGLSAEYEHQQQQQSTPTASLAATATTTQLHNGYATTPLILHPSTPSQSSQVMGPQQPAPPLPPNNQPTVYTNANEQPPPPPLPTYAVNPNCNNQNFQNDIVSHQTTTTASAHHNQQQQQQVTNSMNHSEPSQLMCRRNHRPHHYVPPLGPLYTTQRSNGLQQPNYSSPSCPNGIITSNQSTQSPHSTTGHYNNHHQAASMQHLDSQQLLRRRDSDGDESFYSSLDTHRSNEQLHQQHHHQHYVPYSADYISTKRQQFNFDFETNQPNQQFTNTMTHSADSIADSSIGLSAEYEHQQQLTPTANIVGSTHLHNGYATTPLILHPLTPSQSQVMGPQQPVPPPPQATAVYADNVVYSDY